MLLRSHRVAWPLLAVLGCGQPADEPTPAPEAAAETIARPPSGNYTVTARVISNDCNDVEPAESFDAFLVVKAEGDAVKTNLPLALPTQGKRGPVARSDLSLAAGERIETRRSPIRDCRSYEVTTAIEVGSVRADAITLQHRASYGDASACGGGWPSQCTTKVELEYALTEKLCAAECTRGAHPKPGVSEGPPPWVVDCACP